MIGLPTGTRVWIVAGIEREHLVAKAFAAARGRGSQGGLADACPLQNPANAALCERECLGS
ncbi:hypothetical protein PSAB6_150056 [Paraburkholderia sabiae]|nr:hypothetical protein PSAB6_150056 [Paraburkholderia sabiae]